jgi:diguanylate cyclase (GGDEF)-like protein
MKEPRRAGRSSQASFIVDRMGTILGFDQGMEALTGWPAVDVVGRNKELGGDHSLTTLPLYVGDIPMASWTRDLALTLHCRDGSALEVESTAGQLSGPGERMLVTVERVLSRMPVTAMLRAEDRYDALTGLLDRDAFSLRLAREFRQATLKATPLVLLLADIDHLRKINDRLGHEAGDEILRKLAGILRVTIEDDSRVARLGEDDFAILMPDAGRGEARQTAALLRSTVERFRFLPVGGQPKGVAQVTLSLGAASFPADAESEAELMVRAREALDEARRMGRNRVWCYLRRPRVPLEVPVFFDGADPLLLGYARDLSPSGLFVQTAASISVGMRCALAFPLPGHESKVHVIGRVVRAVQPELAEANRVPGIGVEFERFCGTSDREAIESFLHRHEGRSLRPEGALLTVPR